MDTVGERKGGMNGESSIETHTSPYAKQKANRSLSHITQGAQIWCSVITQRGGMGWDVGGRFKKEGTYVYLWLIHGDVWQKPTQYCKAIILQLKTKIF